MLDFPCVILAGGKSSRMGTDKSLLPFGGYKTLTEYQISRLTPLFSSLHVSAKEDKFDFKTNLILDENDTAYSPMVAFAKILENFSTHVFMLSVDVPYVGEGEIKKMSKYIKTHDIIIAKTASHKHPLCGFYSSSLAKKAKELAKQNRHKIMFLHDNEKVKYVDFQSEEPFTNLNCPNEYKKAIKSC